jgi:hypothetical protein
MRPGTSGLLAELKTAKRRVRNAEAKQRQQPTPANLGRLVSRQMQLAAARDAFDNAYWPDFVEYPNGTIDANHRSNKQ